ncbi:MAG: phenylalanine--tRNA ligase subunit alpha [Micromonosporaceae bacterium]
MSAPNKSYDPVEVTPLSPGELRRMLTEAVAAISAAGSLDELKAARLAHFGDRSPLKLANREIGALPPAARAEAGKRVGTALAQVREALDTRQGELEEERDRRALTEETVDVTLPWDRAPRGARHPVTTLQERLADVFVGMGYEVAEGPEIEADWYNFDALNMGPDHPARSEQDTFFIAAHPGEEEESGMVLRTHTSPVQIRALLTRPLPVYVVVPGRAFRTDELDATHSPIFHQLECLAVDEGLTMADLRGAIGAFVGAMFGEGLGTRFRPSYFPFTEPSAEVDMQCHVCRGTSVGPGAPPCRTCKSEGWIELGGCGMVNPRVLVACGIDPERYSGYAFGLGIERTLMLRHGVADIRDIIEGDVRFTRAFGMEV